MKSGPFYTWILILALGISQAYSHFREHFSGKHELRAKIKTLETKLERSKMQNALAEYQFRDFRQTIAALLPNRPESTYVERNLASVIQSPNANIIQLETAESMFQNARGFYRSRKYEKSNRVFQEIIDKHPFSNHIVESYFMLSEGHYRLNESVECLDAIETMINLFPENDLTGFAMVMMADILVQFDRPDDALQVLETIKGNFNNPVLIKQVEVSMKEVKL